MNLPEKYKWLGEEPGPKMLLEALALYGTLETPGIKSNPVIMQWAKETGVIGWYPDDAVAWCGLFVGVCAKRAGWPISPELLSALSWAKWGRYVTPADAALGDVLVFTRTGGGHVGLYVGESKTKFLVLGGNQSDAVNLAWVEKNRLFAVRRAPWKIAQPANVRKIYLDDTGAPISKNEA